MLRWNVELIKSNVAVQRSGKIKKGLAICELFPAMNREIIKLRYLRNVSNQWRNNGKVASRESRNRLIIELRILDRLDEFDTPTTTITLLAHAREC